MTKTTRPATKKATAKRGRARGGRRRYEVSIDFETPDLLGSGDVDEKTGERIYDGRGPVVWSAGGVIELEVSTAAWVNKRQPDTLTELEDEPVDEDQEEEVTGDA